MMEPFYKRVHVRLIELDRKRPWLLKQTGITPSTWNSWVKFGRIPPADRSLAIADALGVSVEFLVAGRESPFDFRRESPLITEITRRLLDMREDQLDRLLSVLKSIQREEPDEIAERMEKLTDLLTELAKHVEGSKMTRKDKEKTKDLLNRIVLNIYEQKVEVKDEWASLEALES
jgi:transcriptional regulator with XRE-family HTH domain